MRYQRACVKDLCTVRCLQAEQEMQIAVSNLCAIRCLQAEQEMQRWADAAAGDGREAAATSATAGAGAGAVKRRRSRQQRAVDAAASLAELKELQAKGGVG